MRNVAWMIVVVGALVGCGQRFQSASDGEAGERGSAAAQNAPSRASGGVPAGASCQGRDDCPSDQACMASVCRYRRTSVAGEVLASSARGLFEAGDAEAAARSYEQALEAFTQADAPPPPDVLCRGAAAALTAARTPEARELAAKRADTCFRGSLPGDAARDEVRGLLARLRYDGLDLPRFDRPEPADRFFSLEPSRPTMDAIEIAIDITESESPGHREIAELLRGEGPKRAIADCFVQDWELRHERQASATLTLQLQTRLRDMGDYDVFEATVNVAQTTLAVDGFERCLASALPPSLTPTPRINRETSWREPFTVSARLQ